MLFFILPSTCLAGRLRLTSQLLSLAGLWLDFGREKQNETGKLGLIKRLGSEISCCGDCLVWLDRAWELRAVQPHKEKRS